MGQNYILSTTFCVASRTTFNRFPLTDLRYRQTDGCDLSMIPVTLPPPTSIHKPGERYLSRFPFDYSVIARGWSRGGILFQSNHPVLSPENSVQWITYDHLPQPTSQAKSVWNTTENKRISITSQHETLKATRFLSADAKATASLRHTARLSTFVYTRQERRSIVQAIALTVEVRVQSCANSCEIRGGTKWWSWVYLTVHIAPYHEMLDNHDHAAQYHILSL
jgi:hypothetical protein